MLNKNSTGYNIVVGHSGEDLAVKYLLLNKYRILQRNFRCKLGEIDIVAEKDGVLTFVEVKTRYNLRTGMPAEAVTFTKQQRIRRIAQYYLQCAGLLNNIPILSFDVIEIVFAGESISKFKHYEHCF